MSIRLGLEMMSIKFMDIDAFAMVAKKYSTLLSPAFALRNALRSHVVGPAFWEGLQARRTERFPSRWANAETIIRLVSEIFSDADSSGGSF
jgi:hypothetical protein